MEEIVYDGSNMTFRGFDSSKVASGQDVTVIYRSEEASFTVDIVPQETETGNGTEAGNGTETGNGTEAGNGTETGTGAGLEQNQKISLEEADIFGVKSGYPYTGKAICPVPTVKIGADILRKGIDYDISYVDNENAGVAILLITGKGNYTGLSVETFKINPISCMIAMSKTKYKASTLKMRAQKAMIVISGSSGKKTFKYPKKYISVSKSGVVTLKKHMPKGVYKIKVTVAAKENYKKTTKTFRIVVK